MKKRGTGGNEGKKGGREGIDDDGVRERKRER